MGKAGTVSFSGLTQEFRAAQGPQLKLEDDPLYYQPLSDRAILSLSGPDTLTFMQGLITADIHTLKDKGIIYSLMLTPQGKFLYDFFITQNGDEILLDCAAVKYEEIAKKLAMYKLRSNVVIRQVRDEWAVLAVFASRDDCAYFDPRCIGLGLRAILRKDYVQEFIKDHALTLSDQYQNLLYELTIPEAETDLIPDKSFPLEFGLDALNAISFDKGCYIGQELTARTKHRGVVRKKLYKVTSEHDLSGVAPGAEIQAGGVKIGILCSSCGNKGKALIREEDYQQDMSTFVDSVAVRLSVAGWYS